MILYFVLLQYSIEYMLSIVHIYKFISQKVS